jgi:hypothetical protein
MKRAPVRWLHLLCAAWLGLVLSGCSYVPALFEDPEKRVASADAGPTWA